MGGMMGIVVDKIVKNDEWRAIQKEWRGRRITQEQGVCFPLFNYDEYESVDDYLNHLVEVCKSVGMDVKKPDVSKTKL